jgi:uncharacterized protein
VLRVVFDTVIFVRGLINPHGRWGRLVFAHYQDYDLIISEPIATEILEVLHRPELRSKFRGLEGLDVAAVIALLGQAAAVDVPSIPPLSRDPKDDKFLATAAAARADYLVSEDQDLLVLEQYQGVKLVDAATFLRVIAQ